VALGSFEHAHKKAKAVTKALFFCLFLQKVNMKKETDKSITAWCEAVERRVIKLDCKNPTKKPLTNQEMSVSKSRTTISS